MVKRHHRRVDNFSVLANVGNSIYSNNAVLPIIGRHKRTRAPIKARDSDDTNENRRHFGLGDLFLEIGPASQKPKHFLRAKKTKALLSKTRVQNALKDDVFLSDKVTHDKVGLSALTHSDVVASKAVLAAKQPSRASKLKPKEATKYLKRSKFNSGYDADKDKTTVELTRRSRRVPMHVQSGLLSMFSATNKITRFHQSKNDDMAWLCSRLDNHCSIADACKKRSAAPMFLADSLCKRIDQKATPAKDQKEASAKVQNACCSSVCEQDDSKPPVVCRASIKSCYNQVLNNSQPTISPKTTQKCAFEQAVGIPEAPYSYLQSSSDAIQLHHPEEVHEGTDVSAHSPSYKNRSLSQEHIRNAYQDCQALSTGLSAALVSSSLAGVQGGHPVDSSINIGHGCIFTNHKMEMAQVSPVTLASPLVEHWNSQVDCPATANSIGCTMSPYDDGADADTEADAPKLSIKLATRQGRCSTEPIETNGCISIRQETNNKACHGTMSAEETEVNSTRTEPKNIDNTWIFDETSGQTTGAHHEAKIQPSHLQPESSAELQYITNVNEIDLKISLAEKSLLLEPLRRSRRARKRTDRFSIEFGGGTRNPVKTSSISPDGSPDRSIPTRNTRVRTRPSVPLNGESGKVNRNSHECAQTMRRSKRAPIPTAFFHNMYHPKNVFIARKRGQEQKGQTHGGFKKDCPALCTRDQQNLDNKSIEDDFLAESSTTGKMDRVVVGTAMTTLARQWKESSDSSGDATVRDADEELLPFKYCHDTRRLRGFRIASRKPPQLKKNLQHPWDIAEDNWTSSQFEQLYMSYNQSDPLSPTFWYDVSLRVDGKSSSECQAKWFSLAKTPTLKRSKARTSMKNNSVEDDIFNATPTRRDDAKSSLMQGIVSQVVMHPVGSINRLAHCPQDQGGQPSLLRQGYKKYLLDMRRDVNRAEKGKTKKQIKTKPVRLIADQNDQGNMQAKLTPGGTLEIRHHDEFDEWDESMYDADEEDMDSCT